MTASPPDESQITAKKATLVEHLRELRKKLLYSALALILTFSISYFFVEEIYQFLVAPLAGIYPDATGKRLIYTGLTEVFFTYMKLAFYTGAMLAFPFIALQFYSFLAPGLYRKEKKVLIPYLMASPMLFVAGAAMAYYGIFPVAWKFFASFETLGDHSSMPIALETRVSEYLGLVMSLIMGFGLAFQLPVVITLLARAGFISSRTLTSKRRYAIVGIFILAAILTPPDVISQIGLALPLLVLYEGSIIAVKLIEKRRLPSFESCTT
ncbi:MAG: twin-arginine translocase subunit TatC [Rectinemataceae bacterium]|nr:twin-arginine translocase subunit TatC [Rectinemataceae bacterium]